MILFIVRSFYKIDGHQSDPNDNLDAPAPHKFKSPAKKYGIKCRYFTRPGFWAMNFSQEVEDFIPANGESS